MALYLVWHSKNSYFQQLQNQFIMITFKLQLQEHQVLGQIDFGLV